MYINYREDQMNIVKALILLIIISPHVNAKFYVGLGAGLAHGKAENEVIVPEGGVDSEFNSKGNGIIGGILLGNQDILDETSYWYQQFAIGLDSVKSKKNITINNVESTISNTRQYWITGKLGYGINMNPDWSVAFNAGIAQTTYAVGGKSFYQKSTHPKNIWGIASGLGLYKCFNPYKIGMEYEYTIYQRVKKNINMYSDVKVKKPQYHAIMLTFSKAY